MPNYAILTAAWATVSLASTAVSQTRQPTTRDVVERFNEAFNRHPGRPTCDGSKLRQGSHR